MNCGSRTILAVVVLTPCITASVFCGATAGPLCFQLSPKLRRGNRCGRALSRKSAPGEARPDRRVHTGRCFGDAGFAGVAKAMRALRGGSAGDIFRIGYAAKQHRCGCGGCAVEGAQAPDHRCRDDGDVSRSGEVHRKDPRCFSWPHQHEPFRGWRHLFARRAHTARAEIRTGVIVTQVVPAVHGYSSLVLEYKAALAKNFSGESPDYVSLEYSVAARVLIEALKRAGPQFDTEKLVETFEGFHDLDVGLGAPVSFSKSEHQGSHKSGVPSLMRPGNLRQSNCNSGLWQGYN